MASTTKTARPAVLWGHIVPKAGPIAVDTLLEMPDDGYRYEVVEGILIRMAGSGFDATTIGGNVYFALRSFVQPRRMGAVTPADGVYRFPNAETGLLPDVGFVEASKVLLIADRRKPIPFAPDLAVEVASPDQTAEAMAAKSRIYLNGGTRLVWVVWPARREVDVWRRGEDSGPVSTLTVETVLDGGDVVPGFFLPVADIFADPLG